MANYSRAPYCAAFGLALISHTTLAGPSPDFVTRALCYSALIAWPYFIYRRLNDIGASGLWAGPLTLGTITVAAVHLSSPVTTALFVVLHSPLLFMQTASIRR